MAKHGDGAYCDCDELRCQHKDDCQMLRRPDAANIALHIAGAVVQVGDRSPRLPQREHVDAVLKILQNQPIGITPQPSAGPAVREEGLPYGIIDPDYAAFFTVARLVAWSYGYGVGLHGSFTRDLDLILVPWTDRANPDPDHVLKNIESRSGWKRIKDDGSKHPHGRLVWTLTSRRFECPRFIDIGFMPLTTPDPRGPSVEDVARAIDGMEEGGHCGEDTSEIISRQRRNKIIRQVKEVVVALFPAQAGGE